MKQVMSSNLHIYTHLSAMQDHYLRFKIRKERYHSSYRLCYNLVTIMREQSDSSVPFFVVVVISTILRVFRPSRHIKHKYYQYRRS